jgi:DNA adenine methylase
MDEAKKASEGGEVMLKTKPLKPLLKWAGGKTRLAPIFQKLYEPHRHRRLVEPFCGGLGVALGLMPDRALLNDINEDLIGLYRSIQWRDFKAAEIPNTGVAYYMVRDRFNAGGYTRYQKSQDFYYLNTAGYNGLCRYNKGSEFNTPYGKRSKLSTIEDFSLYYEAFKGFDFDSGSYNRLVVKQDDFIVCDPPYDSADDKAFTAYSGNKFGWQEQVELANWLDRQPKIPQVACNLATDRIVQLYTDRGWDVEYLEVGRSISRDGNGRKKVTEMLATRYL